MCASDVGVVHSAPYVNIPGHALSSPPHNIGIYPVTSSYLWPIGLYCTLGTAMSCVFDPFVDTKDNSSFYPYYFVCHICGLRCFAYC